MKHEIQYYLDLKYPTTFIEKEGGFWVWHPDLGSGSVFGFGETLEEAIDELNEARKATFEYLFEKNMPIPMPSDEDEDVKKYSGQFVLRTSSGLHAQLAKQAKEEGVSLNSYCNELLTRRSTEDELLHRILEVTSSNYLMLPQSLANQDSPVMLYNSQKRSDDKWSIIPKSNRGNLSC